jgi:hypothetical protein
MFDGKIDPYEEERVPRERQDISGYEDAFGEGEGGTLIPRFGVGDRIILERRCSLIPGSVWYSTNTYTVKSLDTESGDLRLWNDERGQWDLSNWVSGFERGNVYKLTKKKRVKVHLAPSVDTSTPGEKRKPGRPKKPEGEAKAPPLVPVGEKRGRGRPRKHPLPC